LCDTLAPAQLGDAVLAAKPAQYNPDLPSAEYCFRVARRMFLTTRSAGAFWLDDFALIFVPYGHCDETKTLPRTKPNSVSKGLMPDNYLDLLGNRK